ncbi:MAG: glutamate--tRNA ligase [Puniceicoccales bacterium]|jgi:glutamyl-tRNA synthetase|nr:glutamate--tRNA ligase [Puniceicoccales bacterium]
MMTKGEHTSEVRVRFAPSPTGFFHIGSARTALFNWLYARHCGGKFILRIEDTDRQRNTEESLRVLFEGMKWLGLDWDEGPEKGGNHAPYFQSERGAIYEDYLQRLFRSGHAYRRDGAVWFRVSGKPAIIHDEIRGDVVRLEEKDFVIVRSDGSPVFHFVNVVDDIAMGITHVIRGEDHLSNSSKHVELFQAFAVAAPKFAHIPLILKTVGSGKMSKRDQGALIEDYQRREFLPEAVRNYLCLLGWSPKEDREILPIGEIISLFELQQISKNNARFDEKKLTHMNGEYLRALPVDQFVERCRSALGSSGLSGAVSDDYFREVMAVCQEKIRNLETLGDFCGYFFRDRFPFDEKAMEKLFQGRDALERIDEFLKAIQSQPAGEFSGESLENLVGSLAESMGVKTGDYIHPVRFALSGKTVGPSFYHLLKVLGKERVEHRLRTFLGGFTTRDQ